MSTVFDYVNSLDIEFKIVDLIRASSHIPSPDWIKSKKATINPKDDDNECFKYAITVALSHNEIYNHLERISNIKKHTHKYNWNNINFLSQTKDWEQFEKDNTDIALNILPVPHNEETIELQYKSKHNKARNNQVVLLMTTDGIKWHYLALKSVLTMKPVQSISRLFTKITSTNTTNDYYCFNCFHSFRTENKLKEHESICENHDYCRVLMPEKKQRIIEYKPGTYSLKKEFVIYLDIECKLAKHKTCSNDPGKSYSKNINTHIPTGYSLNVVSQNGKSKHYYHGGIDFMTELVQNLLRIGN